MCSSDLMLLAELEAAHRELGEKHLELVEERRELVEENRELDAQNRELEEHNRRLHERLNHQAEGQGAGFPRPARRSQGLSALIGRPATSNDAGARLVERSAEGTDAGTNADGNTQSPMCRTTDTSASHQAAGTATDVGARFIGDHEKAPDRAEAPSPHALLAEWYQRYPGAFFKGHTRPLKVGIHEALAEQEPWPEKLVRRALACYVNLPRYLKAVREGAERIDLDGKPAGQVDAKAAEHARKKLERLQAEGRGKGGAVPGQPRRAAGKGKPGRGKTAGRGAAGKGPASKAPAAQAAPGAEPPQPARSAPATLEEKLAALVAKHRQQ